MSSVALLQDENRETPGQLSRAPSWLQNLPDLTERLEKLGVYNEYAKWRDHYSNWRKGGAKGAGGEGTVDALSATDAPAIVRSQTDPVISDDSFELDERIEFFFPLLRRETVSVGDASSVAVAFVIAKNFFGSAFMITPKGFEESGLLGGALCLLFVYLQEVVCMLNLIKCRQAMGKSVRYEDLGTAIGSWFPPLITYMIVLCQFGFCCIWLVSNAENLSMVVPEWNGTWRLWIQMVPLFPLVWVRKLKYLAATNVIGIGFTAVMVVFFFVFMSNHLSNFGPQPVKMVNTANTDMLLWLGSCAYAYEGINIVLPTYESAVDKSAVPKLLVGITSFNTLMYIVFGCLTYLAFGAEVGSLATLNLPKGSAVGRVIPMLSVTIGLASFPLQAFVIYQTYEPKFKWSSKALTRKWQKNALRTLGLIFTFTVTWLGGEQLQNFLALVGGVCCASLALIFPSVLHIAICKPQGPSLWLDKFILLSGVCILILSTSEAIASWK